MKFLNLTPHPIVMVLDGITLTFEPSGQVARLREKVMPQPPVILHGEDVAIPIATILLEEVENLPAPEPGWGLIVSAMVRLAVPERDDLFSPGAQVRDAEGRIIGCKGLVCNR